MEKYILLLLGLYMNLGFNSLRLHCVFLIFRRGWTDFFQKATLSSKSWAFKWHHIHFMVSEPKTFFFLLTSWGHTDGLKSKQQFCSKSNSQQDVCSKGICDSNLHIYPTLLFRKFGSEATTKAAPLKHVMCFISLYRKPYIMTFGDVLLEFSLHKCHLKNTQWRCLICSRF